MSGGKAGEVVLWDPSSGFEGESIEMPVNEVPALHLLDASLGCKAAPFM